MSGHSALTRVMASVRRPVLVAVWTVAAVVTLAACATSGHSQRGGAQARPSSASPSSQVGPAEAAATVRHVFAPLDSGGAPSTGVAAHRSGTCFTSSITVRDRLAYRCFASNQILDPCFAASRSARDLYCYADPWSKATKLRITKALPAASAASGVTRPWAIELPGGNRCLALTGTVTQVHGVALGYRCDTGSAGLTRSHGPQLTALYRASNGTLAHRAVVAEWSG